MTLQKPEPEDPTSLVDSVHDAESFLLFANALLADRMADIEKERIKPSSPYAQTARGWYNTTLESFLECATAWFRDSDYGANLGSDSNPWKVFAHFLLAGKMYE